MGGRAPTLAEQAAVRELAALVDGPRKLRWFWRDELEEALWEVDEIARTRCPSRILAGQPRGGPSRRPARPARALCSVPGTDPLSARNSPRRAHHRPAGRTRW